MTILVTGSCGFIGFNLILKLSENTRIIGLDNINNYYDTSLKKKRLKILKKKKNFQFYKLDVCNKKSLTKIFNKHRPKIIYHFAGQAGVQHSIFFPEKYLQNNINGFFNILDLAKKGGINKIIYASSSSVYGDQKTSPLNEKLLLKPKNFYGMSKKNNEEMAQIYSELYGIKTIGVRFFSVFGEWGRPDMIFFKILQSIKKNNPFFLNNYGNHYRDFTYIGDVVKILIKLKNINLSKNKYMIFNICSNKPYKILSVVNFIKKKLKKKPIIKMRKFQIGDIYKTHVSNKKLKKYVDIKFTEFYSALSKTINWNKKYLKLD